MRDIHEEFDRAIGLYLHGRATEAAEIGRRLLARSRGTPHAASIHRQVAEFLHAGGAYEEARQLAREAGSLARATRQPGEGLAAALVELACTLYEGQIGLTHKQLEEIERFAGGHPEPLAFKAELALLVGQLDAAQEAVAGALGKLDDLAPCGRDPMADLLRIKMLHIAARARLLEDQPGEALALLDRALALDSPSPIPDLLGRALVGLALVRTGETAMGREYISAAPLAARPYSADVHGRCLAVAGLAHLDLEEPGIAAEQLRSASGLLTHPIERQEVYWNLGMLVRDCDDKEEAIGSFRQATEPGTDTLFGRRAVRALRELLGLRVV
ncbi:MAG: hypothetical protein JXR96_15500 [Deltaproteobacteria bacterium]|nr:hypothetical protein [Deltaproteobacteria bacterium]